MTDARNRRAADKSPEQKEHDLANALEDWKRFSIAKFDEGAERMHKIETTLLENTKLTVEQHATLKEVLGIVTTIKGGKTILGWGGKFFMWGGGIAAAMAAIKALITGTPPWH